MKVLLPLLSFMLVSTSVAAADDSTKVEGRVAELQGVTEGDNSLRVALDKSPPLCGNAFTYAYVDGKDDSFKVMIELLTLAKSTKAPVMLVSRKDFEGHCKLLSVTVR